MAVNKVIVNNETRLDLTADTVSPSVLFEGYTAHDASGQAIVGTASQSGVLVSDTLDTNGGTIRTISVANSFASSYKNISSNGTYNASSDNLDGYSQVIVNVPSEAPTLQTKTVSYTPSETQQASTVTADNGYDGLNKVNITVGAIPSTYVGSGVNRKTSSDLTASGATVTVPAGYYNNQASKTVSSGSAGTPSASKGTVSNHSVSVTPSVTNTTGYITGGTKTGTAVIVSAS